MGQDFMVYSCTKGERNYDGIIGSLGREVIFQPDIFGAQVD